MKTFWTWFKTTKAYKILNDSIFSIVKEYVTKHVKAIITIVLSLVGVVGASQTEMVQKMVSKTFQTFTTDEQMRQQLIVITEQNRKLTDKLSLSESINLYEREQFKQSFKQFVDKTDKNFKILQDSLSRANKRVSSFSQGEGTVVINGGGEVREGRFSDAWIDSYFQIDSSGNSNMDYSFSFGVKEVSITTENEGNGSKNEIYSVDVVSTKDSNVVMNIGNFVRTSTYLSEEPKVEPEKQHGSINGNILYSGSGVEISASYSFWTFGDFKLLEIGLASDFQNNANLYIAPVRYNIGSPLPVFSDLWLLLGIGWDFIGEKKVVEIGVGTTL